MRVIAGTAGGIPLQVPKRGVRPTMDRVKAAIFSSLGERMVGARVLDLFAGSGALGIEALSRGAASAIFVEQDRAAITAIEKNLAAAKVKGGVRQQDVFRFLRAFNSVEKFDFIFADPPYEKMENGELYTDKLLTDEQLPNLLAAGGIFVLEKRPDEHLGEFPFWTLGRRKAYGATEVLFLSSAESREAGSDQSEMQSPKSEID